MVCNSLTIGMVAHDKTKPKLKAWAQDNKKALSRYRIMATGTTAGVLSKSMPELDITALKSGPLGGDQQLGAMIAEEKLDGLFFFVDPLTPQPHDVDVKALIRLSTLYDIPVAFNQASANMILQGLIMLHEES